MTHSVALVVDNSLSMRTYIRTILQDELNFRETHEAENADEALRFLKANTAVKWVFSAWEMSGMSSHDFLGSIRADLESRGAHVVLVTGKEEIAARELAIKESVADYLCKPFSPEQLVQKVRRLAGLMERRRAERIKMAVPCEVDLGFDPFHVYSAELVDISATGCRVRTSPIHPNTGHVGDLATITFLLENDAPLQLHGKIKRVESRGCVTDGCVLMAFELIHQDPAQSLELERYIELCKSQVADGFH